MRFCLGKSSPEREPWSGATPSAGLPPRNAPKSKSAAGLIRDGLERRERLAAGLSHSIDVSAFSFASTRYFLRQHKVEKAYQICQFLRCQNFVSSLSY